MKLEDMQDLLPEVVQHIAALIGYPSTLELIRCLGGTTFPIGKGVRSIGVSRINMLKEVVGNENADKIIQHFGGEDLYIPRCSAALAEWRNRQFMVEFNELTQHKSARMALTELCPKYGFSDRLAWRLLSRRHSQIQDSLF